MLYIGAAVAPGELVSAVLSIQVLAVEPAYRVSWLVRVGAVLVELASYFVISVYSHQATNLATGTLK